MVTLLASCFHFSSVFGNVSFKISLVEPVMPRLGFFLDRVISFSGVLSRCVVDKLAETSHLCS